MTQKIIKGLAELEKYEVTYEIGTIKNNYITKEINTAIKEYCEDVEYYSDLYVGVRFEDLNRNIGDICENSKDNPDREDERDLPEYGTQEYEDMEELEGTSTWHWWKDFVGHYDVGGHAYILVSDKVGDHPAPDEKERLLVNPVVIAKLW